MAFEYKDYYAILGVPRTATADEIKKAFRALARKTHPDVAKDKKNAESKFKEINEAYEVLGDSEKRKKYDTLGPGWRDQAPGFGGRPGQSGRAGGGRPDFQEFEFGGTGFSDFFEQVFGGRFAGAQTNGRPGRTGRPAPSSRGSDAEGDIAVTLEEAARGAIRQVSMRRTDPHSGEESVHTFRVRIPPGVTAGQVIRVPGKGESGADAPGDLFLHVRLAAHPDFEVEGADLHAEVGVAPWEAVLGAEVPVRTLDGVVTVRIPAGAQSGQTLRIRGRGMPRTGDGAGDLYVTLVIKTPAKVSDAERALWERLRKESTFDPRADGEE
jgi:curved DNA-binding protein